MKLRLFALIALACSTAALTHASAFDANVRVSTKVAPMIALRAK